MGSVMGGGEGEGEGSLYVIFDETRRKYICLACGNGAGA
jgi:hypothetical protein